jgi:hypothetical protein
MPKQATKKTTSSTGAKRGRLPSSTKRGSTFARLVNTERKRLQKLRDKVHARKIAIDRELADLERDLQAMGAFVSSGKFMGRPASRGSSGGGRAGRGQRRQQVLNAIRSAAAGGATRGEIIEKLSAKGDKALEQSISNALAALFKSKAVKREDGRYRAA